MDKPWPLFHLLLSFHAVVSRIWTQIIGVEGADADHWTTTTALIKHSLSFQNSGWLSGWTAARRRQGRASLGPWERRHPRRLDRRLDAQLRRHACWHRRRPRRRDAPLVRRHPPRSRLRRRVLLRACRRPTLARRRTSSWRRRRHSDSVGRCVFLLFLSF